MRAVCTLLFGVAVILFFGLAYPHHLHYQEQYQLFLFDSTYVWDIVKLPGGVADLLGRFCTQFFLYAWMGALIIAVLLSIVQLLTLSVIDHSPLNADRSSEQGNKAQSSKSKVQWLYGLSFVPSFLLWLFLLDENALLGGVWAVLLTLLAVWIFDKLPSGWMRRILLIVAVPVLYWMVGPVCLVAFLVESVGVNRLNGINGGNGKKGMREAVAWCCAAFVLLAILPFLLSFYLSVPSSRPVVTLLSFVLVAVCMGALVWKNSNFKAEKVMQYDFMARHQQWNRILETIHADKPNNPIGVTVQNLALAMRGMLADHMFEYHQNGISGLLPDVERDATSPMPTAEAFYQLGMIPVAQRAVFEAQEAILDYQKSARCYKRLAQTNLITGSYEVARKYLLALQKTLFYSKWANETLPLLGNEKAIAKHPEYGRLRRLAYDENFFFADQTTPKMLQSLFFSNTENRLAYEYLMADYLLTGDLDTFAEHVGWGEKLGYPAIPRHFQEALALRWSIHHEKNEPLPPQVSPEVAERFKQFVSYFKSSTFTQKGLAHYFGDTYWYYYFTSIKQ